MNILRLTVASVGGAKNGHSFDYNLAQDSEAGVFGKIKAAIVNKIEGYKAQAREEQGTEQVLLLSDSMLKDIGLTQTDRYSLKAGLTSLEVLNARREANRGQFDLENR